jgi:sugar/nucleoside kinase (ribokinase family)
MTRTSQRLEPVDYLVIGHIAQDVTPTGLKIGGTAAYSALTAKALGLRVGVVTACTPDLDLSEMDGIAISALESDRNTTFENIYTPDGRIQYLHHQASTLNISHVPETWRHAPIVHLAPIAQEIDPNLAKSFPDSLVGLTPQGWLRSWDKTGRVSPSEWPEASYVLEKSTAAIISIEDVQSKENRVDEILSSIRILAVTEAAQGSRVYWNGDLRRYRPPAVYEVDATGSGDIYAAAFFFRLWTTRDPWEAGRFATNLASYSVTRRGLEGIPTFDEIQSCLVEVLPKY